MNTPSWARPSVKVVCVKKGLWTNGEESDVRKPIFGDVLTIRTSEIDELGRCFLRFDEIKNPIKMYKNGLVEVRFLSFRFRPLITRTQEQDVALFVHHLEEHKEKA